IKNYLIEGGSGTGKTSVATELERRGYHVVHGDRVLAYVGSNSVDLVDTPDPLGVSPNDAIRDFGWSCECLARLGVAD
ncbi:hypothetical protein ACC760_39900, partial [Rhizobium ruizarguesonis]